MLTGPAAEADRYAGQPVLHASRGDADAQLLVQATAEGQVPPDWTARGASLEELALAYLRDPGAVALPGAGRDQNARTSEVTK